MAQPTKLQRYKKNLLFLVFSLYFLVFPRERECEAVLPVYRGLELHVGRNVGKDVAQGVADAGAVVLEEGLLAGPESGEGLVGVFGALHFLHLAVVHGVAQQGGLGLDETFHVDAHGAIVDGHGDGVGAVAEVEVDMRVVVQRGLAVFADVEAEVLVKGDTVVLVQ